MNRRPARMIAIAAAACSLALGSFTTPSLAAQKSRGGAAEAAVITAEVQKLGEQIRAEVAEEKALQAAENARFNQLHMEQLLEPEFQAQDPGGVETAKRIASARASISKEVKITNDETVKLRSMIAKSELPKDLKRQIMQRFDHDMAVKNFDRTYEVQNQITDLLEQMATLFRGNKWSRDADGSIAFQSEDARLQYRHISGELTDREAELHQLLAPSAAS